MPSGCFEKCTGWLREEKALCKGSWGTSTWLWWPAEPRSPNHALPSYCDGVLCALHFCILAGAVGPLTLTGV